MTNYILIYDDCCFYEIVLLGYFMRYSNMGEQPCSYCMAVPAEGPHRDTIRTAEGFRVQADTYLEDIDPGRRYLPCQGRGLKRLPSQP